MKSNGQIGIVSQLEILFIDHLFNIQQQISIDEISPEDGIIDTAFSDHYGRVFVFSGTTCTQLNQTNHIMIQKTRIQDTFPGIVSAYSVDLISLTVECISLLKKII